MTSWQWFQVFAIFAFPVMLFAMFCLYLYENVPMWIGKYRERKYFEKVKREGKND